jgi:uncharacterized protein
MGIAERWKDLPQVPADVRTRLEGLIPLFEEEAVELAYLFGSLVYRNDAADVDLALLGSAGSVFSLWSQVVDRLGTERVDLIDLANASPVLRFDILRHGQLLYARSEEAVERFTMDTLHLYRDTAPLRKRQREYLKEGFSRWS